MKQSQQISNIFEDVLLVKIINDIGGRPGHISRVHFTSEIYGLSVVADINNMIFPLNVDEKLIWVLSRTLLGNNQPLNGNIDFQFVLYGKVDTITALPTSHDGIRMKEIRISYGGSQQCIQGEAELFQEFKPNMNVYFMLKRQVCG